MVTFRQLVIPVLVMVIFVGGGLVAYQVADLGQKAAARDDGTTVTNESHIQQVGMWQFTSNSTNRFTAGFSSNVTVYNNSSTELVEGQDYEWNATDGSIFFYNTASTNDGDPFTITYTYFQNTEGVRELSGPIRVITEGVGSISYLAAGLALVVFVLGFGAFLAKYLGSRGGPRTNR